MKEEEIELKRYQDFWSKVKSQVSQTSYFSDESLRKLIHSKRPTQFHHRYCIKWVQFSLVLFLLVLTLLGENQMLNLGNKHGIILLSIWSVVLLIALLIIVYELYLFQRIHQFRYQVTKQDRYIEQLQQITHRCCKWSMNTTNPMNTYVSWWRISGAVACVILLIGASVYFITSANNERALKACTFNIDIPQQIDLEEVLSNNKDCDVMEYYQITEEHLLSVSQPLLMEGK